MPGHNDGTICKVSEMNKELPEASRREFFPLLPPYTPLKKRVLKFPRTPRENFTTLISKIEVNHRLSMVGFVWQYQIKETSSVTKREKRDVFIWKRGLGSSYYLNCGSYKRLSHPLKEELQLFCPSYQRTNILVGMLERPPWRGVDGAGTTGCVTATTGKQMSNRSANALAHKGRKGRMNAGRKRSINAAAQSLAHF